MPREVHSVTPWARGLACVAAVIAVLPATAAEPALEPTSGCPAWCRAPSAHSWACETLECAPCRETCLQVPLPKHYEGAVQYEGKEESWSCAPVWPPNRFFVVFSMQRTASSTACNVINTLPDSHCAYELLNLGQVAGDEPRAFLRDDPAGYLVSRFEEEFAPYGKAPCTWGLKIFSTHTGRWNTTFHRWLWGRIDTAIILRRENGAEVPRPHPRLHVRPVLTATDPPRTATSPSQAPPSSSPSFERSRQAAGRPARATRSRSSA